MCYFAEGDDAHSPQRLAALTEPILACTDLTLSRQGELLNNDKLEYELVRWLPVQVLHNSFDEAHHGGRVRWRYRGEPIGSAAKVDPDQPED